MTTWLLTCVDVSSLQAFSAMTNEVIWLIVVSFFFAKVQDFSSPPNSSVHSISALAKLWGKGLGSSLNGPRSSGLLCCFTVFVCVYCVWQGFEKTGLGDRVANMFVKAMGKSTIGLSLGLNIAETVLAPAMPSTSARAGGIFMPIIKSLSQSAGSNPSG
jgi:di/tricarboxylate transporter